MMTEMKKCLKLCKYAHQFKITIAAGVFFFVLGWIFLFTADGINVCLAVTYLMLGPFIVIQLMYNMLYGGIVASSPLHKSMDGSFPNMLGIVSSLFAYGMTYVGLLVNPDLQTGSLRESGNVVIAAGIAIAVVKVFDGMAYKFIVISSILFFFTFSTAMVVCTILIERTETIDLLTGSIVGLIIVAIGDAVSCLLRSVLYKCPLSPFAGGNSLRKAMK